MIELECESKSDVECYTRLIRHFIRSVIQVGRAIRAFPDGWLCSADRKRVSHVESNDYFPVAAGTQKFDAGPCGTTLVQVECRILLAGPWCDQQGLIAWTSFRETTRSGNSKLERVFLIRFQSSLFPVPSLFDVDILSLSVSRVFA